MLRPKDTSTRERKSLDGLWQFALDQAGEGRSGQWFMRPLPDAREMAVPASFNDIVADAALEPFRGPALAGSVEPEPPEPGERLAFPGGGVLGSEHGGPPARTSRIECPVADSRNTGRRSPQ